MEKQLAQFRGLRSDVSAIDSCQFHSIMKVQVQDALCTYTQSILPFYRSVLPLYRSVLPLNNNVSNSDGNWLYFSNQLSVHIDR